MPKNMHTKYEHCTLYTSKVTIKVQFVDRQTDGQTDLKQYDQSIRMHNMTIKIKITEKKNRVHTLIDKMNT